MQILEPLKSSIGISLGDTLSLGELNLIVEGFSGLDKVAIARQLIQNLEISSENIHEYESFRKLFLTINKFQQKDVGISS